MYCIVTCHDWPPCVVQLTNVWMCHACLPIRNKDHTIFHPPYTICTYTHSIFHLHPLPSHLSLNHIYDSLICMRREIKLFIFFIFFYHRNLPAVVIKWEITSMYIYGYYWRDFQIKETKRESNLRLCVCLKRQNDFHFIWEKYGIWWRSSDNTRCLINW